MHFITNTNMSTSTRIMRSKGESDGLSLPTRTRPTRKDTISGRNGGTAPNTTFNTGRDEQQQMPTQMPHLPTQSPQATSAERMETTALMLPSGPHRPLMPICLFPHHPLLVHGHLPLCSKRTSTARPRRRNQKQIQK